MKRLLREYEQGPRDHRLTLLALGGSALVLTAALAVGAASGNQDWGELVLAGPTFPWTGSGGRRTRRRA